MRPRWPGSSTSWLRPNDATPSCGRSGTKRSAASKSSRARATPGSMASMLTRDQPGGPQLPAGRPHPGGGRIVHGHEGLEVRLGEVVELVVGAVAEVVGALAALARL